MDPQDSAYCNSTQNQKKDGLPPDTPTRKDHQTYLGNLWGRALGIISVRFPRESGGW